MNKIFNSIKMIKHGVYALGLSTLFLALPLYAEPSISKSFPNCNLKSSQSTEEKVLQLEKCVLQLKGGLFDQQPVVRATAASLIAILCSESKCVDSKIPALAELDFFTSRLGQLLRSQSRMRASFALALVALKTKRAVKELKKCIDADDANARKLASLGMDYLQSGNMELLKEISSHYEE